jgi:membrane associated rhomboid family serine protease
MHEASVGHQCPECVAEGRRTQRAGRTTFGGSSVGMRGYVTYALIAINSFVLLAATILAGGKGLVGGGLGGLLGGSTQLTSAGAVKGVDTYRIPSTGVTFQVPAGVADGEYYRLFTAMFIHYGIAHLALNMWALWVLGRNLEGALGPIRYLALYLTAGLGGSVATYVFTPSAEAAGASGAIYGLFAALFILLRRLGRDTSAVISVLVINLVFSLVVPGISIVAHIGGLLTGGVVAAAIAYAPPKNRKLAFVIAVAALVVFFTVVVVLQTWALRSLPPPPPGAFN